MRIFEAGLLALMGLPVAKFPKINPRFGDEAAAGIMWAPREMNQCFQNHKVEPWLATLRDASPAGAIEITAEAISWSTDHLASRYGWSGYGGADFLKEVSYEVSDCPRGMQGPQSGVHLLGTSISMELTPPMPGRLPKVIALRVQTLRGGTLSVPGSALVGGCT